MLPRAWRTPSHLGPGWHRPKTPKVNQPSNSNINGTAAQCAVVKSFSQESEHFLRDCNPLSCLLVDLGYDTVFEMTENTSSTRSIF